MKGYTDKPCEGCGELGPRPIGSVCATCKQLLKEAREARARQGGRDTQLYRIPGATHGLRSYYVPTLVSGTSDQRDRDAVRNAIMQVASLSGEPLLGSGSSSAPAVFARSLERYDSWMAPSAAHHLFLAPPLAQALDQLDQAIAQAFTSTFQAGVNQGSSLLGQLAAGKMSTEDFNKKTVLGDSQAVARRTYED